MTPTDTDTDTINKYYDFSMFILWYMFVGGHWFYMESCS